MDGETQYDTEQFFNLSLDMLCIASIDGYFKRINASFERILGWPTAELLSRSFFDFTHPEDLEATVKEVEKLGRGIPTVKFEHRFRCADGSYRHLAWTSFPVKETGLLYAIARDVTERKQSEEKINGLAAKLRLANNQLRDLASSDPLTGLKNRRAFDERLAYLIAVIYRTEESISLLMLDVDHFKQHNDQYGHQAGDQILMTIASLLAQNTRAGDTVARYGGEEFAVILPNASAQVAILIGEKLRIAVQNHPWEMKPVTISVGVSTASFEKEKEKMMHTDLGVKLIQEADQALYESKSRGRNLTTHISQKG